MYAYVNILHKISEIRHPEELSLCKPLDLEHLKFNYGEYRRQEEKRRRITLGNMGSNHSHTNGHYKSSRQISASMAEVFFTDFMTIHRSLTSIFVLRI